MVEDGADPNESFHFIAALFGRLLSDASSNRRSTCRKFFLDENSYMLYKVVDYEFGESAQRNLLEGEDLGHLRLLQQLFDNYNTPTSTPMLYLQVIIWTISKMLSLLSSPIKYDHLGGLYEEHVIALCKKYLHAEA